VSKDLIRTSSGIREALFEEWEMLRKGKSNSQKATAVCRLAHAITYSVKTDIEYQRFVQSTNAISPSTQEVASLKLGLKIDET
jgi:hypothetical protein